MKNKIFRWHNFPDGDSNTKISTFNLKLVVRENINIIVGDRKQDPTMTSIVIISRITSSTVSNKLNLN